MIQFVIIHYLARATYGFRGHRIVIANGNGRRHVGTRLGVHRVGKHHEERLVPLIRAVIDCRHREVGFLRARWYGEGAAYGRVIGLRGRVVHGGIGGRHRHGRSTVQPDRKGNRIALYHTGRWRGKADPSLAHIPEQCHIVHEDGGAGAGRESDGVGLDIGQGETVVGCARRLVGVIAEEGPPRDADMPPAAAVVHKLVGETLGAVPGHVRVGIVADDHPEGGAGVGPLEPESKAVIGAPVLAAQVVANAAAPPCTRVRDTQHARVGQNRRVGHNRAHGNARATAVIPVLEPSGRHSRLKVVHRRECVQTYIVHEDGGAGAGRESDGVGLDIGQGETVVGCARRLVGVIAEEGPPRDADMPPAAAVVHKLVGETLGAVPGHVRVGIVADDHPEGGAGVGPLEPESKAVIGAPVLAAQVVANAAAPPCTRVRDTQHARVGQNRRVGHNRAHGNARPAPVIPILEPGGRHSRLKVVNDGQGGCCSCRGFDFPRSRAIRARGCRSSHGPEGKEDKNETDKNHQETFVSHGTPSLQQC